MAVTGQTLSGAMKKTIFDSMGNGLIEVKNVIYLPYTTQLQAQVNYAMTTNQPYLIIVNMNTTASQPLLNALKGISGSIVRYNPADGLFYPY
jgi:hypothetical protein